MVRQRQLETDAKLRAAVPLLAIAIHSVGHAATRSRGTIVGSLCHADPAAELPVCAVAMNASLELQSKRGKRSVLAEDFFTGIFSTVVAEDEMVTAVRIPRAAPTTLVAFDELARRRGDFAMASVACVLQLDSNGAVSDARIVFGGVGDAPVRGSGGERMLIGMKPQSVDAAAVASAAAERLSPYEDIHATASYRKSVAGVLTERVLKRAFASQTGSK
jgi:CO/xanthine dehydrogenase FAD-binding subunit